MERSDLIIAVLFFTAFACSPTFGADALPAADLPPAAAALEDAAVEAPVALAARNLRAGTILHASDFVIEGGSPTTVAALKEAVAGKEIKRTIYAGKPLAVSELGLPTVIKRNAIITIEFIKGPLVITTDGRALDPGAVGDSVRVMNLSSRITLSAIVVGVNKVVTK